MEGRINFYDSESSIKSTNEEESVDFLLAGDLPLYQEGANSSSEEPDKIENNDDTLYLRKSRLARTHSQIIIQTSPTQPPSIFERIVKLGQGTFASVGKFSDGTHEIAVKKPRKHRVPCRTAEEQAKLLEETKLELEYLRRAYPEEGPYSLYKFAETNPDPESKFPYLADWRIIEPMIPGVNLLKFIDHERDPDLIAAVIYNIAIELQRIHECGIIHGDISIRNIMVMPDLKIHFIDFDFAYDVGTFATTIELDKKTHCYFAPERINSRSCPADPAQDIYSLAYAFNIIANHFQYMQTKLAFHHKYDCIIDFIAFGLNHDPSLRKPLYSLLADLKDLLLISQVKLVLENSKNGLQQLFLENLTQRYPEREALRILFNFCNHQDYYAAQNLVDYLVDSAPNGINHPALEVITLLIECGKNLKNFTGGFYNESSRKQIIESMLAANQLMDLVINHPDTPCSTAFAEKIMAMPTLKDAFVNLGKQGYLKPESSIFTCTIL